MMFSTVEQSAEVEEPLAPNSIIGAQLATRPLHERLDSIGKPAPCAPSVVDLRFFPCLGLRPEFVRSV